MNNHDFIIYSQVRAAFRTGGNISELKKAGILQDEWGEFVQMLKDSDHIAPDLAAECLKRGY